MDLNQLIAHHGAGFYLITLVWTFLEGETVVLFAGFAAAQGLVNPALLLGAAWLGSFAGDQCYFWLGRHFGVRLLGRFPRWHRGVDTALHWLERYDAWFILSFRFIYGVRNFSSFALGLSAVRWKRFPAAELPRRRAVGGELCRGRLLPRPCVPRRAWRYRPLVQPGDARRLRRDQRRRVAAAPLAAPPPAARPAGDRRGAAA